jgi:4-methylaminobutanoate oxidase (formaldehyde-forming)
MFGHTVGAALGLGYITNRDGMASAEWLTRGRYEVEVAMQRVPARISLRSFYDPTGERVRG